MALLIETSNAYARGLLSGIADYVQTHGPWSIYLPETGRSDLTGQPLLGFKGDGVIVRAENPRTARAALACGCPIVDLSLAGHLPGVPCVHSDVRAEAAAGFDHLWERGYRHLGFVGIRNYAWAQFQLDQFETLAREKGVSLATYLTPLHPGQPREWSADRRKLAAWLKRLPRPVGIFACYDLRGQQVLDACRHANLRVPDDVAVIGVDNDTIRCTLSDPPLSSVAPDTQRIGHLAAELLARLMGGEHLPPSRHLIPPRGLIARRSSDALAIDDPDIAQALRFIRDHACDGIGVKQVMKHVTLSRRTLESKFLRFLGRTPHAEIIRCRLDRARQLLTDTDLPIKAIASKVGVGTPEYLCVLFTKLLNTSPSAYRQRPRA